MAAALLQSTLRFQADPTPFPFERLPPEIRLQVYHEALTGNVLDGRGNVLDGLARAEHVKIALRRPNKLYFIFPKLDKGESNEIDVGFLTANRLMNNEATAVLYRLRIFDFGTDLRNICKFLSGLSDKARQNVRGIRMELHDKYEVDHCCGPLSNNAWGKGPDNQAAWNHACTYIAQNTKVTRLYITVDVKVPTDFKALVWVRGLVQIKNLKALSLEATQHLSSGRLVPRASYKNSQVSAADPCFSQHLVSLFEYLCEEMLE